MWISFVKCNNQIMNEIKALLIIPTVAIFVWMMKCSETEIIRAHRHTRGPHGEGRSGSWWRRGWELQTWTTPPRRAGRWVGGPRHIPESRSPQRGPSQTGAPLWLRGHLWEHMVFDEQSHTGLYQPHTLKLLWGAVTHLTAEIRFWLVDLP